MRTNYLKQLSQLEKELITMGSLCEAIITKCVSLIGKSDLDLKDIKSLEGEINQKERELENLCIRILLLQNTATNKVCFRFKMKFNIYSFTFS